MNATAHLTFDRKYYETKYDDWLRHRAKWRKYSLPFSLLLVFVGLVFLYLVREQWVFGAFVTTGGIFELITSLTYRQRWIKRCLRAKCTGKAVEVMFNEEHMTSTSANGTSSIKISALDAVVPGSNGLFLIPDHGQSIYIPQSTIDPPDAYQPLLRLLVNLVDQPQPPDNNAMNRSRE